MKNVFITFSLTVMIMIFGTLYLLNENTVESLVKRNVNSVYLVESESINKEGKKGVGMGTGFLFNKEYVVTNAHVVGNAKVVTLISKDGKKIRVPVVATDVDADVAVVRLVGENAKNPPRVLRFCRRDEIVLGEDVIGIGHPWGLIWTITRGIVSGYDRFAGSGRSVPLVQTDTKILQGNSGGPLISVKNDCVVAMNTMVNVADQTKGRFGNIPFSIDGDYLRTRIHDLIKHKKIKNLILGIQFDSDKGLYVKVVVPFSLASKIDMRIGDIIHSINGKPLTDVMVLKSTLYKIRQDEKFIVTVQRDGKKLNIFGKNS